MNYLWRIISLTEINREMKCLLSLFRVAFWTVVKSTLLLTQYSLWCSLNSSSCVVFLRNSFQKFNTFHGEKICHCVLLLVQLWWFLTAVRCRLVNISKHGRNLARLVWWSTKVEFLTKTLSRKQSIQMKKTWMP